MAEDEPRKKLNPALKWSGMAFQMAATTAVCVWLGMKLDAWQHTHTPWWTLALALIGVVGSMYLVIREVNQAPK